MRIRLLSIFVIFALSTTTSLGQMSADEAYKRLQEKQKQQAATTKPIGPGYYWISFEGEFGKEITADYMEMAINAALRSRAEKVVIYFDTPGGDINELNAILSLINRHRDVGYVALVKRATSAGAIAAAACPTIIMDAAGTIGAAVPYTQGPGELPKDVDAKFKADLMARQMAAAESAGHNPLIIRGMIDDEIELAIQVIDGKPQVFTASASGQRLFKKKGEITSLTPAAAVECGLASGVVKDRAELAELLGDRRFHEIGNSRAMQLAEYKKAIAADNTTRIREQRNIERKIADAQKTAARNERLAQIAPDIQAIDNQLSQIRASGSAAEATLKNLQSRQQSDMDAIDGQFRSSVRAARLTGDIRQLESLNLQVSVLKSRVSDRYSNDITTAQATINDLSSQQQRLLNERQKLIRSVPAGP